MPLYKKHILDSKALIVVWEMQESTAKEQIILEGLSELNQCMYADFQSSKRKREFLFSRHILESMMGVKESITYSDVGAPLLGNTEVSISHSGNFVAVGISPNKIGIDIQVLNPKIGRIAPKFVNEKEAKFVEDDDDVSLKQQTIIWSAKEALYKLDAEGGLLFKEHLHVSPFVVEEQFCISAKILRNKIERACQLRVWHNNNYTLVIAEDEI